MVIDKDINNCNLCGNLVEHFPNSKTVSVGKNNDILILGEAPANNGWRKSGKAWYDVNDKLLPSGVVMQKLLNELNIKLEDTYFLEAIKCYPVDRKNLKVCSRNCKQFLMRQLKEINPKIIFSLGDAATKTILDINYKKFSEVAGKEYYIDNMKVIPIYHPSPISPMSYKGNIDIFKNIRKRKKLDEILQYLNDNIEYGYVDINNNKHVKELKNFRKLYITRNINDTIKYGVGTCIEQVNLINDMCKKENIESKMFCTRIYEPNDFNNIDEEEHMHCFILIYIGDKVYHLEHPNFYNIGIFEYDSEMEAINNINNYYINLSGGINRPLTQFYEVESGLTFKEFNNYINNLDKKKEEF